ncbi:Retrotransposon gag domain [Ceraceosorus bombacis]|uniref:Retrotransposon gag domain n=1 Tax=Ceraceosorus bombacis TaxID=401625 RepID=A0A0P1BBQ5_9BASI|nr:Retrotransposon gag domain [Ceraceosorus bombacis]
MSGVTQSAKRATSTSSTVTTDMSRVTDTTVIATTDMSGITVTASLALNRLRTIESLLSNLQRTTVKQKRKLDALRKAAETSAASDASARRDARLRHTETGPTHRVGAHLRPVDPVGRPFGVFGRSASPAPGPIGLAASRPVPPHIWLGLTGRTAPAADPLPCQAAAAQPKPLDKAASSENGGYYDDVLSLFSFPSKGVKMEAPKWEGQPKTFEDFIYHAEVYFSVNQIPRKARPSLAITFLKGRPRDLMVTMVTAYRRQQESLRSSGSAVLHVDPAPLRKWSSFIDHLRTMFLVNNPSAEAIRKLQEMRQTGMVSNYVSRFHTQAAIA